MHRLIGRLGAALGVAALAAGGLVVVVPQAGAAPATSTVCATTVLSGPITGNLTVPAGSFCTLTAATVTGNARIDTQGALTLRDTTIERNVSGNTIDLGMTRSVIMGNVSTGTTAFFADYNSTIGGNLSTTSSFSVNVIAAEVLGNASFHATTGYFSFCGYLESVCGAISQYPGTATTNPHHPYKLSNVSITTTQVTAEFEGNTVSGNLTCSGNGIGFTPPMIDFTNTVGGHATGQCATPTFP